MERDAVEFVTFNRALGPAGYAVASTYGRRGAGQAGQGDGSQGPGGQRLTKGS